MCGVLWRLPYHFGNKNNLNSGNTTTKCQEGISSITVGCSIHKIPCAHHLWNDNIIAGAAPAFERSTVPWYFPIYYLVVHCTSCRDMNKCMHLTSPIWSDIFFFVVVSQWMGGSNTHFEQTSSTVSLYVSNVERSTILIHTLAGKLNSQRRFRRLKQQAQDRASELSSHHRPRLLNFFAEIKDGCCMKQPHNESTKLDEYELLHCAAPVPWLKITINFRSKNQHRVGFNP